MRDGDRRCVGKYWSFSVVFFLSFCVPFCLLFSFFVPLCFNEAVIPTLQLYCIETLLQQIKFFDSLEC